MLLDLFQQLSRFLPHNNLPDQFLAAGELAAEVTVEQALLAEESPVCLTVKVQPFAGVNTAVPAQALALLLDGHDSLQ